MFVEEDGSITNNKEKKNFKYEKMLKTTQFCNF